MYVPNRHWAASNSKGVVSSASSSSSTELRPPQNTQWIKYEPVGTRPSDGSGVNSENTLRYAAYERPDGKASWEPMSVQRWARALALDDPAADRHRDDLSRLLARSPHDAFFFETKGASADTAPRKPFEFVLVDSPYLRNFVAGGADPETFREHLRCAPDDAPGCAFVSLSGDATLVAPRREGDDGAGGVSDRAYAHLGAFVREAPPERVNRLWRLVGQEYLKALDRGVVWLSTDGTGVAWLHLRLDTRPKYYSYREFAKEV